MNLLFKLDESLYSIPAEWVVRVMQEYSIFQLPFIKNIFCAGFIQESSRAIPVLNMRRILGLGAGRSDERGKIIIFSDNSVVTAVLASQVIGVEQYEISNKDVVGADPKYIAGTGRYKNDVVVALKPKELIDSLTESLV